MKILLHCVVSGLLFSLHLTVPYLSQPSEFSPFAVTPSGHIFDETHFYAPGPHRFMRFGLLSSDTDVFEERNTLGVYPQGPSLLLGALARIFGDFEWTWILAHALFPTFFWLAAWYFFKSVALAWGLVLLGFGPRFSLLLSQSAWIEPPDLTRLPNPLLSGVLLLLALGFIKKALLENRKLFLLLSAVTGALLFEFYPFYALPYWLTLATLGIFFLIRKSWVESKAFLFTFLISTLISGRSLWQTIQLQSSSSEMLFLRQGFLSREISFLGISFSLIGAVGLWFTIRKKRPLPLSIGFALLLACGLLSNLQVVTGKDLHYALHYRMRLIQPVAIAIFFSLSLTYLRKPTLIFLTLLFCLTSMRQYRVGNNLIIQFEKDKNLIYSLRWLKKHSKEPAVVATSDIKAIALLPAVSGHWSFVPSSYRTLVTDEEILERYAITSKIEGFTLSETLARLKGNSLIEEKSWTQPLYFFLRKLELDPPLEHFLVKSWNKPKPNTRKLDYILINNNAHSDFVNEGVTVYKNAEWVIKSLKTDAVLSQN